MKNPNSEFRIPKEIRSPKSERVRGTASQETTELTESKNLCRELLISCDRVALRRCECLHQVPQGRSIIAHRFNGGIGCTTGSSPGRGERNSASRFTSIVPAGTRILSARKPSDESLGYSLSALPGRGPRGFSPTRLRIREETSSDFFLFTLRISGFFRISDVGLRISPSLPTPP